jgi:hypothetical protein
MHHIVKALMSMEKCLSGGGYFLPSGGKLAVGGGKK